MKGNVDRFHLIPSTGDSNQIQIGNSLIREILCEKLLDVKFGHKLAFDHNIKSFCEKAKAKLNALARVVSFTNKSLFLQLSPTNIDDS